MAGKVIGRTIRFGSRNEADAIRIYARSERHLVVVVITILADAVGVLVLVAILISSVSKEFEGLCHVLIEPFALDELSSFTPVEHPMPTASVLQGNPVPCCIVVLPAISRVVDGRAEAHVGQRLT